MKKRTKTQFDLLGVLKLLNKQSFVDNIPSFKQLRSHPMLDSEFNDWLHTMVYVVDLRVLNYVYVSPNAQDIVGYSAEEYMKNGLSDSVRFFHPDEIGHFLDTFPKVLKRYFDIPVENRMRFKFTLLFRNFNTAEGQYKWLLQQNVALFTDEGGHLVYVMGMMTDVTHLRQHHKLTMVLSYKNSNGTYEMERFEPTATNEKVLVTKRERDIIRLLSKGLSSRQIAEQMSLSTHTINTHRKNILNKTSTHNVVELVSYATSAGLI